MERTLDNVHTVIHRMLKFSKPNCDSSVRNTNKHIRSLPRRIIFKTIFRSMLSNECLTFREV